MKIKVEQEQNETIEKIEKDIIALKWNVAQACSMSDDARADAETARTFATLARNDIEDAKANAELAIDLASKVKAYVTDTMVETLYDSSVALEDEIGKQKNRWEKLREYIVSTATVDKATKESGIYDQAKGGRLLEQ